MKLFTHLLAIVFATMTLSCDRLGKSGSSAEEIQNRLIGTWTDAVDESSFMKLEKGGSIAYLKTLTAKPTRVGTWELKGNNEIEMRFDWLDEIKRFPEKADEIRAFVEREPESQIMVSTSSFEFTEGDSILVLSGKEKMPSEWRRVGKP
jgi:hypothetical protein